MALGTFGFGIEIVANMAMGIGPIRNWRAKEGRTSSVDELVQVDKILRQFEFFCDSVGREWLMDKVIAEIGPGDALSHGLLFAAAGAARYVAIDRFSGNYFGVEARSLYRRLTQRAPVWVQNGLKSRGLVADCYPRGWASKDVDFLNICACSIEDVDSQWRGRVDLIVSYNVLEHLKDVGQAMKNMADMLKPGGMMVHRVDYGPHGIFQECANPLEFLTLSETMWRWMGSNRGFPNRVRHSELLRVFNDSGFDVETLHTCRFPSDVVDDIRPFLLHKFSVLSDDALRISDAEYLAVKSGNHLGY